jgi:hypothetical protein
MRRLPPARIPEDAMHRRPNADHAAFQLRVRDGFALPDYVLRYLAEASVDALSGQGTQYRNACRNLSELTRLVGEVLHRARARSHKAVQR